MNGIVGWLFFCEALHKMLFRITALFREVRSSYTLEVILSFPVPVPVLVPVPVPIPVPVPVPNYFWWISKAGITNSWIVLLLVVVSLIKLLVSSSSWSSQRQTLSFFCFKAFCSISLDWLLKKSDAYFFGGSCIFHSKESDILADCFDVSNCRVVSWSVFDLK